MVEDPIVIPLCGVELDSKATDIADGIGATSLWTYD